MFDIYSIYFSDKFKTVKELLAMFPGVIGRIHWYEPFPHIIFILLCDPFENRLYYALDLKDVIKNISLGI